MSPDPFSSLTFVGGSAILTNACAILQNGVNIRYSLAITQWREFRASVAADSDGLASLFVDSSRALELAERRIHFQLHALNLLNAAAALFGAATVGGVVGALLTQVLSIPSGLVSLFMAVVGAAALGAMLAALVTLFREGACGRSMVRLHHLVSDHSMTRNLASVSP